MKPVEFADQTVIFAKDQPEYQPLPAHVTHDGVVTSCWELDPLEVEALQSTRRLWLQMFTFGSAPQPILPTVFCPDLKVRP